MPKVFRHNFKNYYADLSSDGTKVIYKRKSSDIPDVPWISWSSGNLWVEASLYLANICTYKYQESKSNDSAYSDSSHLKAYGEFLENHDLAWDIFPEEQYDRPTYQFRGHLISLREMRKLAPTTVSSRISSVKRFYIWAIRNNLLNSSEFPPFELEYKQYRYLNTFGIPQLRSIISSDLSIPVSKVKHNAPEDGLYPIRKQDRDLLLSVIDGVVSKEYFLMLKLGFFTGMRIGTILDLTDNTFRKAFESTHMKDAKSFGVGPKYGINTKKGVQYFVSIPNNLWKEILHYCDSVRRAIRVKKANENDKSLVFLSQQGKKYKNNSNQTQIEKMRLFAPTLGLDLSRFYFHCTRATFGSIIVDDMMSQGIKQSKIMAVLMALMGHVSSASSLLYIKFLEEGAQYEQINKKWSEKW